MRDDKFPWVSENAFQEFENALVFSSVDIIIVSGDSFLLGRRRNEPGRGMWGLPGGLIRRGELREEAVYRIGKLETTLDTRLPRLLGSYDHVWETRQYVSCCYITEVAGNLRELPKTTDEFVEIEFFKSIPPGTHENYVKMLQDASWTS